MILVIYEDIDHSTVSFINFCIRNEHKIIALKTEDLVLDDTKIVDTGDSCTWTINDNIIDINELSGVYLRTCNFKKDLFKDYKKSDIEYVRKEWWSYFIYRISNVKNCINPLTLKLVSSLICETPYFLNAASEVGLNTPDYIFSHSYSELEDVFYKNDNIKYICQSSLEASTDFRASINIPKNTIGLIQYIKGSPIFVHVIDDNVFACIQKKEHKYSIDLSHQEKEQCILLVKKLDLCAAQIILIEQEESMKKFCINVSAYPNWSLAHNDHINILHQKLLNKLINISKI